MNFATENRPRILIVDDERFNLNMLNGLLNQEYKIMVATSGEQALMAVSKGRPDLVLLDINMPGMDGYDVCNRLKSDPITESIPIIFITANSSADDETRGLEMGAADYITKPFNPSVVKARVRTQIRLKQQADLLTQYAFKDGLTGVTNRRSLDDHLPTELKRCSRANTPFSLIMLDIDYFKLYNDHYGHLEGDQCLKRVAKALKSISRRPTDEVARYGGEEFVILLTDTDLDGAKHIAEEAINAVREAKIEHQASKIDHYLTISLGVTSVSPAETLTAEEVLAKADSALYLAKQNGRNRFEVN
jgi:diguanylate cyclase (GGDEF)-like protein